MMTDTVALITLIPVAIQSTNSLNETIKRYKDRRLRRLQRDLEAFLRTLKEVHQQVCRSGASKLPVRPVCRYNQLCREFESSIEAFGKKPKPGLTDWAKIRFKGGDIDEFIDTLAGYSSTISIWLTASLPVIRSIRTVFD